jgi:hypothetical protein
MAPPRSSLDPQGYYARLGINPAAAQQDVVAAYRRQARVLHPDVPTTGNAEAFLSVKQAYDVLSNRDLRATYDETARKQEAIRATVAAMQDAAMQPMAAPLAAQAPSSLGLDSKASSLPSQSVQSLALWAGLGSFLLICIVEAVLHLRQPPPAPRQTIRPNAAVVAPLSPDAHQAVLYGPTPEALPGTPNFYVIPAGTPAVLWRKMPDSNRLAPAGKIPPFSTVQGLRVYQQVGMIEVMATEGSMFIDVSHLTPGNAAAAHRAYCTYNAGPAPFDGELLERHDSGSGTLEIDNRAVEPAVVKLRKPDGAVAVSVFLAPGGHTDLHDLPTGPYQAEFGIGEFWSRACNGFAAGMRARRIDKPLVIPSVEALEPWDDAGSQPATDITDHAFEME